MPRDGAGVLQPDGTVPAVGRRMGNDRLQEALHRLQRQDPLRLGSSEVIWHVRLLEERRYSRIFELRPETARVAAVEQRLESDAIVLKLYHAVQAPRRQREFEDLQRVHELCGESARRAVVRPVVVYPDLGALFTARAPGRPGSPLVRRACRAGAPDAVVERASTLCARAGAWLRDFQGSQDRLEQVSPHLGTPEQFESYVAARLEAMQQGPFPVADPLRRRALAALRHIVREHEGELRRSVWSHSDFGPHNLLTDASRLTVLDFELLPQHAWFDAAYYVESLAGFAGPLVRAERVCTLQREFLDAYGASGDEPLFLVLRLRHLACTAASLRAHRSRFRVLLWPEFARLRRRLQDLVVRMERCGATSEVSSPQSA